MLLTSSLVAKITDFGNSRFVNFQSGKVAKTLTTTPGTPVYMPPEAMKTKARYGPSLDIFSFGHLALFVGLQVGEEILHNFTNPNIVSLNSCLVWTGPHAPCPLPPTPHYPKIQIQCPDMNDAGVS